jgi:cytidylate kinase
MENKNIITISGVPGTGTTTIARLLSKKLDLQMVYIGELFRELAKKYKMTLEEFGEFAKNNPKIDEELDAQQIEYGKHGNVILEGRLSGCMMIKNTIPAYKILLTATLEERIKRIMGRENKKYDLVRTEILTREKGEGERYKRLYGLDYKDPSNYDLVIDTTTLTPEEVITEILVNMKIY